MQNVKKILVLVALFSTSYAHAVPIWDNGSYNEGGAIEASNAIGADDFSLTSSTTITGANMVVRDVDANAWDQSSLTWYIFDSNVSSPGSLLASGGQSSINVSFLGASTFAGKSLLDVSFEFDSAVSLLAGDYWFGFSTAGTSNGIQWLMSNDSYGSTAEVSSSGASGPWNSGARDMNFRLTSAPEPGILSLMALGLAGFGFTRRKIK